MSAGERQQITSQRGFFCCWLHWCKAGRERCGKAEVAPTGGGQGGSSNSESPFPPCKAAGHHKQSGQTCCGLINDRIGGNGEQLGLWRAGRGSRAAPAEAAKGHLQGYSSPIPPGLISPGVRVLPSRPGSVCWLQAVAFG